LLKTVIGRKVIAKNGEIVGKVKDVAFDSGRIIGVVISCASIGKVLIDKAMISEFQAESIILNINPITALVNKIVFDKDGMKLGKNMPNLPCVLRYDLTV